MKCALPGIAAAAALVVALAPGTAEARHGWWGGGWSPGFGIYLGPRPDYRDYSMATITTIHITAVTPTAMRLGGGIVTATATMALIKQATPFPRFAGERGRPRGKISQDEFKQGCKKGPGPGGFSRWRSGADRQGQLRGSEGVAPAFTGRPTLQQSCAACLVRG